MSPVKTDRSHRIRAILRSEGRSVVWLAQKTGYDPSYITRVDQGKVPGSDQFWKLIELVLGRDAA